MAPSSSSSSKSSKSAFFDLGLSASEIRILLLGMVFSTDGKVDLVKLANKRGYKLGSARTLYNGARRKLFKLYGDNSQGQSGQAGNAPPPVKKARRPTTGRRRRQTAADAAAAETVANEEIARIIKVEFDDE